MLALVQARKWLGVDKKMEGEIFDHPQPKFQTEAFWKCSNNFHKRPCNFLLKIPPTDLLQILLYHNTTCRTSQQNQNDNFLKSL